MFSGVQKSVLVVLALGAGFVWNNVFSSSPGVLTVSFLDVGQGDATFIETPNGTQILIDGGYGKKVLSELGRIMPGHDKSLDMVIATHTDSDHLGGLVEVLQRYEVEGVIENGFRDDSSLLQEWDDEIVKQNITSRSVQAGDRFVLDEGVYLEILGPFAEDINPMPKEPNEVMVVSRLVYGETEFLLMGDIERPDEIRLASSQKDIASDVLKVAHHGSKYSSTDLFLEKVQPQYSIVSAGVKNNYGHPHPETLERLAAVGGTLFRTDQQSRITLVSDGKTISVKEGKVE